MLLAADVALLKGMLAIADSQYGNLDDDALSVLRRLHEALPLLQLGADVAGYLVSEGKGADARQVIERWIASRPGAEQATSTARTERLQSTRRVSDESVHACVIEEAGVEPRVGDGAAGGEDHEAPATTGLIGRETNGNCFGK